MELQRTGYNVRIDIDSKNGVPMSDLDFTLSFFIYHNKRVVITKDELIAINVNKGVQYYAMLDSTDLGEGLLMCDVTINSPECDWGNGVRPVVLRKSTGKKIGKKNDCVCKSCACDCYESGYLVSFEFVDEIPEAYQMIYGYIKDEISDYSEVTPQMISDASTLTTVRAGVSGKVPCGPLSAGDKVVILLPGVLKLVATKDNGFGGKVPFSTSVMGCNGDVSLVIDGMVYSIYGEMMSLDGLLNIYIDKR